MMRICYHHAAKQCGDIEMDGVTKRPASQPRKIEFDAGRHHRAKIGYILLATEQTIEDDVATLHPPGVGYHFARLPSPDSITRASLKALSGHLGSVAETLLPDGSIDVVTYGCTSGSLVVGEKTVFAEINKGAPGAKATSIITAVKRALGAVGAKNIVVATPYLDEINWDEADYLEQSGFHVLDIQGLNIENDSDMVRVTPGFIATFAASIDRADADAVFISCGALRSLDIVDQLERQLGKPVICSNQAMIWDALRLADIDDKIDGYGDLFRTF